MYGVDYNGTVKPDGIKYLLNICLHDKMVEKVSALQISLITVILILLYSTQGYTETNILNGKHLKLVTSPVSLFPIFSGFKL